MGADTKWTEGALLALLRKHLDRPGNGGAGEYAFMAHVRNAAGFSATRTFDAVALSLWPSRGHTLHVYEVKISRSDWQRELRSPAKAEDACKIADYFSIVAPRGIVARAELPPTWGLIETHGDGVRATVAAPYLGDGPAKSRPPLDRSLVVAMLRSAGAVGDPAEVEAARKAGVEEGKAATGRAAERWEEQARDLRASIDAFEKASGLRLGAHGFGFDEARLSDLGAAVRRVLEGDKAAERAAARIAAVHRQLVDAAETLAPFLVEDVQA